MGRKKTRISRVSLHGVRKNNNNYLYTKGGEFSLNGNNYVGEYHYDDVSPRTGPIASPETLILHRFYTNKDHYIYDKLFNFITPLSEFVFPKPYIYKPTEQTYTSGFDSRFFVEKINDDKSYAIEVDVEQYSNLGKTKGIDNGIYNSSEITWKLTGSESDIIKHNQLQIYSALSTTPSINYAIKNYLEYARITLTNQTTNTITENLYTNGGMFKTEAGQDYIGYYHLHPNKGYMEGAVHVTTKHGYLYPKQQINITPGNIVTINNQGISRGGY